MEGASAEERCGLVRELVQVLEMVRQLDAHMAGSQMGGGGGEERCRALVDTMRASIDRSVLIARSCCAEATAGRMPVFVQPESPPSGGGGGGGRSPISAGADQAGDSRGRGNAAGQCKKRKTLPKWSTQVRVSYVQDTTALDDGLSWRKYGQKDILGAKYPRAYFRCTHRHTQGCQASKQVQRADGDPLLFDVVYHGTHTCAQARQPAVAHLGNDQANAEMHAAASSMFERGTMQQFLQLPSNKLATDNSGSFPAGSSSASAIVPPAAAQATPESQLVSSGSSGYTAGGVQVELESKIGEMDFMFTLDDAADFLEKTASYF